MTGNWSSRVDFLVKNALMLAGAGNCRSANKMLRDARSVVANGRRAKELSLHEARAEREFIAAARRKLGACAR